MVECVINDVEEEIKITRNNTIRRGNIGLHIICDNNLRLICDERGCL